MKQYESYKPSGTPWIGDIPSHWEVVPLKYLCSSERYAIKTGPFGSQLKGDDLLEEGDVRVYSQRNVIDCQFAETRFFLSQSKAKELESFYTKEGDILLTSRGTIGRAAILPKNSQPGILHPCLIAVRINRRKIDDMWLTLWLNEGNLFKTQISLASNATTIEVIYTDTLKNILVPLPPLDEQISIRNYINKKCESIDKVIATQERRIALLTELKQSIITEAVTRGLNPNAPLKDSGIDWIGQIPEHWEATPLKFTGTFGNGLTYTPDDVVESDGILVLRSSNIQDDALDLRDTVFVNTCPDFLMVQPGDIIICSRNGSASLVGKCAMVEKKVNATFGAFMIRYRPFDNPKFGFYSLQAALKMYKGLYSTTTINQLTMGVVAQIYVAIPPIVEQEQIAAYLDNKCVRIDSAIAKAKREIELLREFKQSVITEAVTGKIKVY